MQHNPTFEHEKNKWENWFSEALKGKGQENEQGFFWNRAEKGSKRILVLDVDGVLVNSIHGNNRSQARWDNDIEQDLGIPKELLQPFFERDFPEILIGKRKLHLELKNFLSETNFQGKENEIIRYWFEHDSKINNDILEIARKIKRTNHSVYIATNQEILRASYIWNVMRFKELFDGMFFSGAQGFLKSDPSFFEQIDQVIKSSKDQEVDFFDDTLICVETSQMVGWNSYLYNNKHDFLDIIKKFYCVEG